MRTPMTVPRPVLVVSNHSEVVGGGELSLLGLLERLDRAAWAPIAAVPAEGAVAERCRRLGIPVHVVPLPTIRRPGRALVSSILELRRLLRRTEAVLVHANGSRAMFYAGIAGRLGRQPVVWHLRIADRDPILDRLLLVLSHAVIVNSKAVGRRLGTHDGGKVRCIPNGVDLKRFSPRLPCRSLRESLGVPAGASIVESVGRLVGFKGFADLLESAAIVRRMRPGVHWILVGDGELRGELEHQRDRLGLQSDVHLLGWREDVPDLLALCDVFALPSLGEHFGRVLIEAMAMAKPVVATDAGGVPEVVVNGETGRLVPPSAPTRLAEAVVDLLADAERARAFGDAGRRRVEAEFSLERHAAAVATLYRELVAG